MYADLLPKEKFRNGFQQDFIETFSFKDMYLQIVVAWNWQESKTTVISNSVDKSADAISCAFLDIIFSSSDWNISEVCCD